MVLRIVCIIDIIVMVEYLQDSLNAMQVALDVNDVGVLRRMLELGKIETSFEKSAAAEAKAEAKPKTTIETTRAPAPVASIRGSEAPVATNSREALSFQDYKRLRMNELRQRRR